MTDTFGLKAIIAQTFDEMGEAPLPLLKQGLRLAIEVEQHVSSKDMPALSQAVRTTLYMALEAYQAARKYGRKSLSEIDPVSTGASVEYQPSRDIFTVIWRDNYAE